MASSFEDSENLKTDIVLDLPRVPILMTIQHPPDLVKMPQAESLHVCATLQPSALPKQIYNGILGFPETWCLKVALLLSSPYSSVQGLDISACQFSTPVSRRDASQSLRVTYSPVIWSTTRSFAPDAIHSGMLSGLGVSVGEVNGSCTPRAQALR